MADKTREDIPGDKPAMIRMDTTQDISVDTVADHGDINSIEFFTDTGEDKVVEQFGDISHDAGTETCLEFFGELGENTIVDFEGDLVTEKGGCGPGE